MTFLPELQRQERLIFNGSRKHNISPRAQELIAETVDSLASTSGTWAPTRDVC